MSGKTPDLSRLESVVSTSVLDAMRAAGRRLSELGVRHLIVGGLAVAAHGYLRATRAVDFLVGDEAFEHHGGGIVTMRPGVPIQVGGVMVDHLSVQTVDAHLTQNLPAATVELAVAPIDVLVFLKLNSPRPRDRVDIAELIRAGADVEQCRAYLQTNAPQFLSKLEEIVAEAWRED